MKSKTYEFRGTTPAPGMYRANWSPYRMTNSSSKAVSLQKDEILSDILTIVNNKAPSIYFDEYSEISPTLPAKQHKFPLIEIRQKHPSTTQSRCVYKLRNQQLLSPINK